MSLLVLGSKMIREDDGQRGEVALIEGERRIVYEDRGEQRVAPKKERWFASQDPTQKLRATEIIEVALFADRALRSIDNHVPHRYWEKPALADGIHDQGLFDLITGYLQKRV